MSSHTTQGRADVLSSHDRYYHTVSMGCEPGHPRKAPSATLRMRPALGLVVVAVCGVTMVLLQAKPSATGIAAWTSQSMATPPVVSSSHSRLAALRAQRDAVAVTETQGGGPIRSKAARAALGATAMAATVLTGATQPVVAAPTQTAETEEQIDRFLRELDPIVDDAPPLREQDYNVALDAEYEPQDSLENVFGFVIKIGLFATLFSFVFIFLYGFFANDAPEEVIGAEEEDEEDFEAPIVKPKPSPAQGIVLGETVDQAKAADTTDKQEVKLISLEDAEMADESAEHVSVYFRPIPDGVGYAEVSRLFSAFGPVECLQLKDDYGFVWMNEKAAKTAIAVLHGGEFRSTRMFVGMAIANDLPPSKKQLILRQCQIEFERLERAENRSVLYFRGLATSAQAAAKAVQAKKQDTSSAARQAYEKSLEVMTTTIDDINTHHAVDVVDARSTAQTGLDELVQLATSLKEAETDAEEELAAKILDCISRYEDMQVIPVSKDAKPKEVKALYFRPVPRGASPGEYGLLFDRYGEVERVVLKEGYGFVWMEQGGAQAALDLLQGYRFLGGKLYLSEAKSSADGKLRGLETPANRKKQRSGMP